MPATCRRAFTLVERLAVFANILILNESFLPLLNAAKEEAHAAVCATELNQSVHASFAYSAENDDRLLCVAWLDGKRYDYEW